jgi:hypothetical protein
MKDTGYKIFLWLRHHLAVTDIHIFMHRYKITIIVYFELKNGNQNHHTIDLENNFPEVVLLVKEFFLQILYAFTK